LADKFDVMSLWFVLSLMTAVAIFAVLWPLARRQGSPAGSDVAVYRDQLDEIERDREAGRIGPSEAEAARVEVSRRLLAAADAESAMPDSALAAATGRRRTVAVAAIALIPAAAATLYLALGSPLLPDQPLSARAAQGRDNQSIEALIAQVESHLERNPEDGRGWEVIAPVYLRLGRFDDAVRARRSALRINGETPERVTNLGEALVAAANGVVTVEAKTNFERAVALDAREVRARYFLGLAAEQDGRRSNAAEIWRAMLAEAPPDASWTEFVRLSLARVEGVSSQRGPSEEDIAAAADLGSEQRNAMVRGMVERLAERLQREGSDVDGWLQLMRSYVVLGDREKARAAAADARRALASESDKLRRVDELAKGLGLGG
jgi:cytochrome c-type biogenesis protein CcmH